MTGLVLVTALLLLTSALGFTTGLRRKRGQR